MNDHTSQGRHFAGLRRRIYLTYRYLGWRTLLFRILTLPLRFTPLRHRLQLRSRTGEDSYRRALAWYREHGRPVCIVIPSYRDAEHVARLVASIHQTVPPGMARIIVADDSSGRRARGGAARDRGHGGRCRGRPTRALRRTSTAVCARPIERWTWWCSTQTWRHAQGGLPACSSPPPKRTMWRSSGACLLYPDGRIQFAGTARNLGAPEWFDHRYRFKPADWGPAAIPGAVLAVTGACMYVRRAAIERIGLLDERYPMAYEDVDWCLRAWQAGMRVMYFPGARLYHYESQTRGTDVGERERESQRVFWERWGEFFDARDVRGAGGKLSVVYVTEGTGIGGGHRDIFEHLNRLAERGHEVALYTLGEAAGLVRSACAGAQLRALRRTGAGAGAGGCDQGGDLVEHGDAGVVFERSAWHPRVLRAGHRDQLLPRRRGGSPRGARLLSARVSLHDDLRLEPRASAKSWD